MAIVNIGASASGVGNLRSAYGTPPWGATSSDGSAVGASGISPGGGAGWAVWHVQLNVPAGEPFNGIKMQGYVMFNAGLGVSTRKATLRANMFRNYDDFTGQAGDPLGSHVGNAQQNSINYNYNKGGFTSNDLLNGLFFGITVSTDNVQPELGVGAYSYGALNWTFYTGADTMTPPPEAIKCQLTNPRSNYNPGRFAATQFNELTCQLLQPLPEADYDNDFSLPSGSGLTFAANNNRNYTVRKGYSLGSNPDTYVAHTGLINIASTAKPGSYIISVHVVGVGYPYQDQTLSSNLVVRPSGNMFTEF